MGTTYPGLTECKDSLCCLALALKFNVGAEELKAPHLLAFGTEFRFCSVPIFNLFLSFPTLSIDASNWARSPAFF